jgi:hypothetical protein
MKIIAPILFSLSLAALVAGCAGDDSSDDEFAIADDAGKADAYGLPAPGDTAGRIYFDNAVDYFNGDTVSYHVFTAKGGHSFTVTASAIDDDGGDVVPDQAIGFKLYRLAQHASGTLYWKLITSVGGVNGQAVHSYRPTVSRWYMVETATAGKVLLDLTCGGGDHTKCALSGQPNDACKTSKTCDGGLYCQYPVGSCGSTAGTCQVSPASCPKLGLACFPVCGCDGKTYCEGCDVTSARVSVSHKGACDCDQTQYTDGGVSVYGSWGFIDPKTNDHYSYTFFGKGMVTSEHDPGCLYATPFHCSIAIAPKNGRFTYTPDGTQITITYDDGNTATFALQTNCAGDNRLVGSDYGTSFTLHVSQ